MGRLIDSLIHYNVIEYHNVKIAKEKLLLQIR